MMPLLGTEFALNPEILITLWQLVSWTLKLVSSAAK